MENCRAKEIQYKRERNTIKEILLKKYYWRNIIEEILSKKYYQRNTIIEILSLQI